MGCISGQSKRQMFGRGEMLYLWRGLRVSSSRHFFLIHLLFFIFLYPNQVADEDELTSIGFVSSSSSGFGDIIIVIVLLSILPLLYLLRNGGVAGAIDYLSFAVAQLLFDSN